jgi:S-adenosylmethionine/arginine decarboxylase-like enzyme
MHVTIDGYGGDPQKLADENLVSAFLDSCPDKIGMTKIAPPHVCSYVGAKPQDWGLTGFVLIAESHISVHTFPEHKYGWIDIFSCKGSTPSGRRASRSGSLTGGSAPPWRFPAVAAAACEATERHRVELPGRGSARPTLLPQPGVPKGTGGG